MSKLILYYTIYGLCRCDEILKDLLSRVDDLEAVVRQQNQDHEHISLSLAIAMNKSIDQAYLPRLVGPSLCPDYAFPIRTTTNPPYTLCVRYKPHVLDSFVVVKGHWGQCGMLRAVLLSVLALQLEREGVGDASPIIIDAGNTNCSTS